MKNNGSADSSCRDSGLSQKLAANSLTASSLTQKMTAVCVAYNQNKTGNYLTTNTKAFWHFCVDVKDLEMKTIDCAEKSVCKKNLEKSVFSFRT